MSILTFILFALGVSSYLNIRDEIRRIEEFRLTIRSEIDQNKKELREEIRDLFSKSIKNPKVILLKDKNVLLEGKKINGVLGYEKKHKRKLTFIVTLSNIGKDTASELFGKIYIFDAKRIGKHSSTYPEFGQEITLPPKKFTTEIIPPNASIPISINLNSKYFDPKIKKYSVLMQIWFGKELPTEARFEVIVTKAITKDIAENEDL